MAGLTSEIRYRFQDPWVALCTGSAGISLSLVLLAGAVGAEARYIGLRGVTPQQLTQQDRGAIQRDRIFRLILSLIAATGGTGLAHSSIRGFERIERDRDTADAIDEAQHRQDLEAVQQEGELEKQTRAFTANLEQELQLVGHKFGAVAQVLETMQSLGLDSAALSSLLERGSILGGILGIDAPQQIVAAPSPPPSGLRSTMPAEDAILGHEVSSERPSAVMGGALSAPPTAPESPPKEAEVIAEVFSRAGLVPEYRGSKLSPNMARYLFALDQGIGIARKAGEDLELRLGKIATIDVVSPGVIGVDVPRSDRQFVAFPDNIQFAKGEGKIYLGESLEGRESFDLASPDSPHALVFGTTGSGKSQCLRSIVYCLKQQDSEIFLIGGKTEDYGDLGIKIYDPVRAIEIIPSIYRMSEERKQLSAEELRKRKRVSIILEEYTVTATAILNSGILDFDGETFKTAKAVLERWEGMLTSIICIGRSLGIHVICALQRPSIKNAQEPIALPAALRANFQVKIGFRNDTPQLAAALLKGYTMSGKLLGRGDGVYTVPEGVRRFQGYALPDQSTGALPEGSYQ